MNRGHLKLIGVALSCVAIGVGISAVTSAGAASHPAGKTAATGRHAGRHPFLRRHATRALLRRGVHGELVVATKSGFATVTFDRGTVQSVSGRELTLRDGTKAKTYKTVTLTIPSAARVRVNHAAGKLSQVTAGMRAIVVQGPKRTLVIARTS
jgi:hypothetical protein